MILGKGLSTFEKRVNLLSKLVVGVLSPAFTNICFSFHSCISEYFYFKSLLIRYVKMVLHVRASVYY